MGLELEDTKLAKGPASDSVDDVGICSGERQQSQAGQYCRAEFPGWAGEYELHP